MKRIKAILQLFRIELPLAAGICTLLGAVISAGRLPSLGILLPGFLCVFFISGSLFGLFILISLLPAIFGWLGALYFYLLPVMDGYIIFCTYKLLRSQTTKQSRSWIRWNYLGVTFCLLAFLLARLVLQ